MADQTSFDVYVEQKHIDSGIKSRAAVCPVALALNDKGHEEVYVLGRDSYIDKKKFYSVDAWRFVLDFDYDRGVKPCKITFELDEGQDAPDLDELNATM